MTIGFPAEVFRRVKDVTNNVSGCRPASGARKTAMNYGGMSWQHGLELLDKCPGLSGFSIPANPISTRDGPTQTLSQQDGLEFGTTSATMLSISISRIATWNAAKKDADYNWPAKVKAPRARHSCRSLLRGYQEPFLSTAHGSGLSRCPVQRSDEDAMARNFVEYGKRLERMAAEAHRGRATA